MLRSRNVRKPISVIPTGIDELVFNGKNREATRRRLGIGPSDYIIGHVGRLTKEKNLTFLFNAVRRYLDRDKSAKFLLVGGQSPDIAELLGMFNDMRGSRFIYVGIKRDSELADIYSAMDCFVFSSKVETQGMVLAEAMLCGVPVVAISSTGVNDIVKNGMNGFGTAENYHDFISAIYKCKKMDRSIVSSSAFYFTIEICISKLLGIYRGFARERRLAFGMKTLIGKLIGK